MKKTGVSRRGLLSRPPKGEFAQQYSPDGHKDRVSNHIEAGNLEIWVCSSEGRGLQSVDHNGCSSKQVFGLRGSPDGRQIAFYSNQEGKSQIFVDFPADGGAV